MTRLSGPAFWRWMGLRRVSRGWVARFEGRYYDAGRRMPGYLVPDVLDVLVTQGLLSVSDPDEDGWQRVTLTEAGQVEYQALCRRQRQGELARQVPAPEDATTPDARQFRGEFARQVPMPEHLTGTPGAEDQPPDGPRRRG